MEENTKGSYPLFLEHLPLYAEFLLKHHLEDFVGMLLQISREEDLPLLKYFESFSEKELLELGKKSNTEFLTAIASNNLNAFIKRSVNEWLANNLRLIDRDQVQAEDITLASMVRRKAFRHFLKEYTSDRKVDNLIMEDVDRFTAINEAALFNAYISIQQQKIREANEELEKKTELLEYKNIQLERTNEELESFNYAASHDLQEPLRKIRTFCDRIVVKNKDSLPVEVAADLDKIMSSATRMQNLINDLLNFSQNTTASNAFEAVDLNKMVHEIKHSLVSPQERQPVTIDVEELPIVSVVPFQFEQVFINLLDNALKYRQDGIPPVIKIKSKITNSGKHGLKGVNAGKKYVQITIADNGIGFDAAYSDKIFDLFKRLHSKEKYSGTGIGLALCKKIVQNHEGLITAESEINKGSSFHIYLPEERLVSQ